MQSIFNPGYWTEAELRKGGFASVGDNVRIAKSCTIVGLENISIGSNVRIDGPSVLSASSGYIRLGSHIHIGGFCFLAGGGGIGMADFSGLSQRVSIYSVTDDYSGKALTNPTIPKQFLRVKSAPVLLGKHAIVGAGCVILPGCEIGEGASVGAMSLVSKSLEAWCIHFGIPAKRLKSRSRDLLEQERLLMEYFGGKA